MVIAISEQVSSDGTLKTSAHSVPEGHYHSYSKVFVNSSNKPSHDGPEPNRTNNEEAPQQFVTRYFRSLLEDK